MRPIALIFLVIFFSASAAFGQKSKKEKTIKPYIDEVCGCIGRIEYETGTHESQAQVCITTTLLANFTEVMAFYGLKPEELDEKAGYDLGIKFGEALMENCPAFMTYALTAATLSGGSAESEEYEDWELDESLSDWEYTDPITATVLYEDRQGLLTFTVLSTEGLEYKFTVLTDFQGLEALISGNPKGKQFTFYFENWEIYNPATAAFEPRMVLYAIE